MSDEPLLNEEQPEPAPEPAAEPTPVETGSETAADQVMHSAEHVVSRIEAWFQEHLRGKYPLAVEQEINTKLTQLKQEFLPR